MRAPGSTIKTSWSARGCEISGTEVRRDCSDRLPRDALPALYAPLCGPGEMGLGACATTGTILADAQLHTLLDGPLHAIKFEDGKNEGQAGRRQRTE